MADGSAFGAGGEVAAAVSGEAGVASWYSQALSTIPEMAKTSNNAIARDQRIPPCTAMRQLYRHLRRIRLRAVVRR